jgi:uncharacterized protein (TIGR02145 family)
MKMSLRHFSSAIVLIGVMTAAADRNSSQEHESVKIGSQVWMLQNLNADRFRNGDPIPQASSAEDWVKAGKEGTPAWCYYNNRAENGDRYGKLYNWYAVADPRGLAPAGWRVATDADWREVTDYLGGEDAAGTKMKKSSGWKEKANGTNESGFSGLPGGSRNLRGEFAYGEEAAYWWTSTESDDEFAWYRVVDHTPWYVYRTNYSKANGYSVRCLK